MICPGITSQWFRVGASAIGTSHLAQGTVCQDRGGSFTVTNSHGEHLIAVVSDGAGSARFGQIGAQISCISLSRSILQHLNAGKPLKSIDRDCIDTWINTVRDRISEAADLHESKVRDFAATLVAMIADEHGYSAILIGDSLLAVQSSDGKWQMPLEPMHGTYASSTYFVTDDPSPKTSMHTSDTRIFRAVLFSDGLERIALKGPHKEIKGSFLDSLFDAISEDTHPGRDRMMSEDLRAWLKSESVCEFTDDDKTLLLFQRIAKPCTQDKRP